MLCEPCTRYWSIKTWEKMGITSKRTTSARLASKTKRERPLGALQPPAHGGYQAGPSPALEVGPRLELRYPRVAPVELLVGARRRPLAGSLT